MDYLDPKKALRHTITLYVGYVCIAIGIAIGTLILVYQAYGFGIGKNGDVIQNGLVFFSSQPHPANLYLNDTLNKSQTNARLVLPEGIYKVLIARDGYRDWRHTIEVDGGGVQHYDYPLLFPKVMTPKPLAPYAAAPGVVTQSPDRRWLVVEQANSLTNFDVYDLKNPTKAPVVVAIPETVIAKSAGGVWTLNGWADDNEHMVLDYTQADVVQSVLVDRIPAQQSVNLTATVGTGTAAIALKDKKYDQYFSYAKSTSVLQTSSLRSPAPTTVLDHVLSYKSYQDNTLLYATDSGAPSGKVLVKLKIGDRTYQIKTLDAGTTYLLDLTGYSGKLYVAVGAASMNKVYIYRDPVGQLQDQPKQAVSPVQVLHVVSPNYLGFSNNAQYIVAENAQQFGVYDIENQKGYSYVTKEALDTPQLHATWMDGNRLTYVSNGSQLMFDFDHANPQSTIKADARYVPAFTPDYHDMYSVTPGKSADTPFELSQTSLLKPADQ